MLHTIQFNRRFHPSRQHSFLAQSARLAVLAPEILHKPPPIDSPSCGNTLDPLDAALFRPRHCRLQTLTEPPYSIPLTLAYLSTARHLNPRPSAASPSTHHGCAYQMERLPRLRKDAQTSLVCTLLRCETFVLHQTQHQAKDRVRYPLRHRIPLRRQPRAQRRC